MEPLKEPYKTSNANSETSETSNTVNKKQKIDANTVKITQQIPMKIDSNDDNDRDIGNNNNVNKAVALEVKRHCPYLGTIKRHLLDFDFEKLCSVTLSNLNVYACLVCGKYYQGRGVNSIAYFHSLEQNHHVFINLHNCKVYCLPDNYEVNDVSLEDIKYNLRPYFDKEDIKKLDANIVYCRGLDGTEYIPGCVGLNNIKATDYVNVVIQSLCRVPDLRNFFIFHEYSQHTSDVFEFKTLLTKRFAELIRKIWNPRNFKGHVSPHELLQAVSIRSNKKFRIDQQSDTLKFLAWFLDELHKELATLKKKDESVISHCFRGEVEIYKSEHIKNPEIEDTQLKYYGEAKPFMYLTLDIPPPPLYKDSSEKSTIPQIPLFNLLKKFDGLTYHDNANGTRTKYRITKLPKYLILHMKRFTHNNFFLEKNPTIVNFPINNLDLKNYVPLDETEITKYDLLANICHEGKPEAGVYRSYVRHKALDQWFEIQDLHIQAVMPQQVALSEAYIQIYERHAEKD